MQRYEIRSDDLCEKGKIFFRYRTPPCGRGARPKNFMFALHDQNVWRRFITFGRITRRGRGISGSNALAPNWVEPQRTRIPAKERGITYGVLTLFLFDDVAGTVLQACRPSPATCLWSVSLCGGYNYTTRLRFDGRSTAYQRSLRSQWRNPLVAVTPRCLFI